MRAVDVRTFGLLLAAFVIGAVCAAGNERVVGLGDGVRAER